MFEKWKVICSRLVGLMLVVFAGLAAVDIRLLIGAAFAILHYPLNSRSIIPR